MKERKTENWNPVAGCTRVSAGCDHCYAVPTTHRLGAMAKADRAAGRNPGRKAAYEGLTLLNNNGDRHFNGRVNCIEAALVDPLVWKKPRRVLVGSMADLFHKNVPFEFIDRVFAAMALCPQHTFQVLTKRTERMAAYFREGRDEDKKLTGARFRVCDAIVNHWPHYKGCPDQNRAWSVRSGAAWPLPNVWLGTSVENQQAADERIPHLLKCPAAVRFLSCEPLIGDTWLPLLLPIDIQRRDHVGYAEACRRLEREHIGWVIVGGESGKDARPCEVAWIRSIVEQCKAAKVPCFVKQLGSNPVGHGQFNHEENEGYGVTLDHETRLDDPNGGDLAEWPEELRVREWPSP